MTIEDQIRDALRDDAGSATPAPDGWDDVRSRADAHTRRRRAIRYPVAGLVAAAAIAAIVVGVAALRSTSESEGPSIATPPASRASTQIAAIVDQRLVVLDAQTGSEIRALAEGVIGGVSVDDEYVYFARGDDRGCQPTTFEIARVPIMGGAVELVTAGANPQVSPDGRWLAYNSNGSDIPPPNQASRCHGESEVVVRDLASGEERRFTDRFDPDNKPGPASTAYVLGWSADSRWVLYNVYTGGDDPEGHGLLDVNADGGVLDSSNSTSVTEPAGLANIFGLDRNGSLLISRNIDDGGDVALQDREIALSDPATGKITRSIVDVTNDLYVFHAALDPSGRQVLYVTGRADPQPLRRITIGDDEPVELPVTVQGAAWVPAGVTSTVPDTAPNTTTPETTKPETTSASPQATTPETIVAVDGDGRLIVMASDDSTRRSELLVPPTDGSQYESVSVGPGNAIAVARITPSDSYCATFETGEIQLVNRETSRVETVGQGRYPALSPDGKRLAWVGVADCVTVLRIRDLATGDESVLTAPPSTDGGPDPQLSGPITWAHDSQHLMVPMNVEPLVDWWYVDADAPDGTLSGPVIEQRGEQGGPFAMAFASPTELVAVIADPDGSNLRIATLDLATGGQSGEAVLFAGSPTTIELRSDDTGDNLLLVVVVDGERILDRLEDRGFSLHRLATGITSADW